MINSEPKVWCIHSGDNGEADALFLSGFVALDGAAMGDLASIPNDAAVFKQRARAEFPHKSEKTIEQWAGQWRRFVYEAEQGHLIAFRSKHTGIVHLGRITGLYTYNPQPGLDHAHLRTVQWLGTCPAVTLPSPLQKRVALPSGFYELTDYKADLLSEFPGADFMEGP